MNFQTEFLNQNFAKLLVLNSNKLEGDFLSARNSRSLARRSLRRHYGVIQYVTLKAIVVALCDLLTLLLPSTFRTY